MIDVSWTETVVLFGVGVFLIGRKDLPKASHAVGRQVGRVVGVLQGARARADRFTADNELKALQNELRSGLRELDNVRGEFAVAASGSGLMGRGLGTMVPGANRIAASASSSRKKPIVIDGQSSSAHNESSAISFPIVDAPPSTTQTMPPENFGTPTTPSFLSGEAYLAAAQRVGESMAESGPVVSNPLGLAPRSQSVAAVAEEEWSKQGIGFVSRAEKGTGVWERMRDNEAVEAGVTGSCGQGSISKPGGAALLADLIQQSLIHDQYDRTLQEQDEALNRRAEKIRSSKRNETTTKDNNN